MNGYDELLGPSSKWLPLLERGEVLLNRDANRLAWADNGRFAAKLWPSGRLAESLSNLPADLTMVSRTIETTAELAKIAPALQALQLVSTVGAVASVAGCAISIAGFAAVLHRLKRIEGKLDEMLSAIGQLKRAVHDVGGALDGFFMARLAQAGDCLDRSLAATTEQERVALARDARRLFQEARHRYLQLWKRAQPWITPEIPVVTARELQGRYVACAIGEVSAEFILGDAGALAHAARSAASALRDEMSFKPLDVLRLRSDALATAAGHDAIKHALAVAGPMPELGRELKLAAAATEESLVRVESLGHDGELPALLGMAGHEILRVMRAAPGVDIYALMLPGGLR